MHSNLVTESKVTECNRMSLTIFAQEEWKGLPHTKNATCPEHALEMSGMCPDTRKAFVHTLLKTVMILTSLFHPLTLNSSYISIVRLIQ